MARKTTVLFSWDSSAPPISSLSVHLWLKEVVKLDEGDVVGIQVDAPLKKVWVKLKDENLCFDIVEKGSFLFKYPNGETTQVKAQGAGLGSRLVRIFRLPFEVENSKVAAVLGQYGKVIGSVVDEKFDEKHVFKVRNGIRRARVEIGKHIPSYILVENAKCLVMYAGQPATCMICNERNHIRKNCPQKGKPSFSSVLRNRKEDEGTNDDELEIISESLQSSSGGYGSAAAGATPCTQETASSEARSGGDGATPCTQGPGSPAEESSGASLLTLRTDGPQGGDQVGEAAAVKDSEGAGLNPGRPVRFFIDSASLSENYVYEPPPQKEAEEKRGGEVQEDGAVEDAVEAAPNSPVVLSTPSGLDEQTDPFVMVEPKGSSQKAKKGGVPTRQTRSRAGSGTSIAGLSGGERRPLTPAQNMSAAKGWVEGDRSQQPSFLKRTASTLLGGNNKKKSKENKENNL